MKMRKRWLWLLTVLVIPIGYVGIAITGNLEPTAPPGSTMKTLDEIPPAWSQNLSTAQRFVEVLNGEGVLDKETGLVWEKSPDTTARTWVNAVAYAYNKNVGGRSGWRLPTVEELASLLDRTQSPALPSGHPFTNVQVGDYWSATTSSGYAGSAWVVSFGGGYVDDSNGAVTYTFYVWCVRGGHGYDSQ